jgi:hypothetical protein
VQTLESRHEAGTSAATIGISGGFVVGVVFGVHLEECDEGVEMGWSFGMLTFESSCIQVTLLGDEGNNERKERGRLRRRGRGRLYMRERG